MSINSFVCPICGNTDIHSIGYLNGKPYCRRCISFHGEEVEHKPSYPKKAPIHLEYELSSEQKELSDKLVENYKKGIDSLVYAVCGSGKTEIVLSLISYAIRCGDKVAFAIPRRDVVIELYERLKNIFTKNKVISVYGGKKNQLYGDIVVLTTHQLYRYDSYFDLIIIDEIDAFPFRDNKVLEAMLKRSLVGHIVMLSATPSKEVEELFQKEGHAILKLNTRFHNHPLPVPQIIKSKYFLTLYYLRKLKDFVKRTKKCFIFCPTIEICEKLFKWTNGLIPGGEYVHSKRKNRTQIIKDFKDGKYKYLVTTSILERGVTVKDLQVIIYQADHAIFDSAALIQISGRVGRKIDAPEGEVIYIAKTVTKQMEESIQKIKESNSSLFDML